MTDRDRHFELTDDEALSALIDGMLTDAQAEALRTRLANEPALAARLAALENTDAVLRASYGGVVDEPLPADVVTLLEPRTRSADVVTLARPQRPWIPTALAAGIALAVGIAIGVPFGRQLDGSPAEFVGAAGAIRPGEPLFTLLDSVPSGETRVLAGGLAATPQLTFQTTTGAYCRQVELATAAARAQTLACRGDGTWDLRATVYEPPTATGGDAVYRPAAGAPNALDAVVDALIAAPPLDSQAEASLIASGWAYAR